METDASMLRGHTKEAGKLKVSSTEPKPKMHKEKLCSLVGRIHEALLIENKTITSVNASYENACYYEKSDFCMILL